MEKEEKVVGAACKEDTIGDGHTNGQEGDKRPPVTAAESFKRSK